MRGHLGVGFGLQFDAQLRQFLTQFGEVLDDPVVDDRHRAIRRNVGVGVAVGWATVGRPARVTDPRGGRRGALDSHCRFQVGQLARTLLSPKRTPVGQCHAGGVVAPVLEPTKPRDHNVER
jgi:hypothetical protein